MHDNLKRRVERVSAERTEKLYAGLITLSEEMGRKSFLPDELVRSLRQLAFALAACPQDLDGRIRQLRLLEVTFPILEDVTRYLAAHHRETAAALLKAVSEVLADASNSLRPGLRPPNES